MHKMLLVAALTLSLGTPSAHAEGYVTPAGNYYQDKDIRWMVQGGLSTVRALVDWMMKEGYLPTKLIYLEPKNPRI